MYKTNYKHLSAFTLAEVLITLGIIGVVAAMTIPTLISNTNYTKFTSQFKKSLSTLSQAGIMSQANADFSYGDSSSSNPCAIDANSDSGYSFCALFNTSLKGHSLNTDLSSNYILPVYPYVISTPMYLTLADGSLVIFDSTASGCSKQIGQDISELPDTCGGYIDVNGVSFPNRVVLCEGEEEIAETAGALNTPPRGGADFTEDDDFAEESSPSSPQMAPANVLTNNIFESGTCVVPKDSVHITDIYPIVFHDSTVEPASRAARTILNTFK